MVKKPPMIINLAKFDFPLKKDDFSRTLPWLFAFMTFLACISITIAINLNHYITRTVSSLENTVNIQLADPMDSEKVLNFLREQDTVREIEIVPEQKVRDLVKPWLGTGNISESVTLPVIIEAKLHENESESYKTDLAQKILNKFPNAEVDNYEEWMVRLNRFTRSVQMLGVMLVSMVAGAIMLIIVLTSRTETRLNSDSIDILQLIGASDKYITKQFQANTLITSVKGAALGVTIAAISLFALSYSAGQIDWVKVPIFNLGFSSAFVFAGVIISASVLAYFTTRSTVLKILGG